MLVSNPTNEKLSVQIYGVEYSVDANSSVSGVPEVAAKYWKERLHNFLSIKEEKKDTKETLEREKELEKEIEKKEKELEEKEKEVEKETKEVPEEIKKSKDKK